MSKNLKNLFLKIKNRKDNTSNLIKSISKFFTRLESIYKEVNIKINEESIDKQIEIKRNLTNNRFVLPLRCGHNGVPNLTESMKLQSFINEYFK